jgi:hypothetical protein
MRITIQDQRVRAMYSEVNIEVLAEYLCLKSMVSYGKQGPNRNTKKRTLLP